MASDHISAIVSLNVLLAGNASDRASGHDQTTGRAFASDASRRPANAAEKRLVGVADVYPSNFSNENANDHPLVVQPSCCPRSSQSW